MFIGSEQQRFKRIYEEYQMMVRNILFGITGSEALDDLTQEAFIRIWKGIPRFAFRSSVETWIYRITVNTAIDHIRRKKSLKKLNSELEKETLNDEQENLSYTEIIETALELLDEESRSIVVLFYFEEVPIKKISKILGIPEGTVKSRMHTAKTRMKAYFSSKGVSL